MQLNRVSIGYSEKKVSTNALFSAILGGTLIVVHVLMMFLSIFKKGNLPFASGVIESYLMLFSVFGILWSISSFDEERTVDKYKLLGVILNGIAFLLAVFVMAVGIMAYEI